ncbi:MAG: HAD family hydrolase [Sphingobium sp.]|nr:HAD family hydrolase [Sphingobium sp.]
MESRREAPATVFVDADNTLWDTDGVFAAAQLNLLAAVEVATSLQSQEADRLAFVRAADQGIAERHHAGLRYPPRLLIAALADALHGENVARAARLALTGSGKARIAEDVMASIEAAYFGDLGCPPAIRPGVEAGLLTLEAAGCTVLIVTEAARAKVERTAERLGLGAHFTRIVEGIKRPDLYRRILRLTGTPGAFMVGDQLDRDIAPAKAAGLETIYFPGGFQPRWTPAVDMVRPDHVVSSFAEAARIILPADGRTAERLDRRAAG